MATNSSVNLSDRTNGYAVGRLLKRGQLDMVIERFGQWDKQGKNKTRTRKYRRYLPLAPALSPLAEGIPPEGQELTYEDINCVLEQYGDQVKITDVIKDTHEDNVLGEAMDLCGEQVAETIERLRIDILRGGTNVFLANGVASRANIASAPLRKDFRNIYRMFRRNRAKQISEIISASHKISTEPVAPSYFAVGHTDLDADFRDMTGFIPVEKYSDSTKAMEFEIGKIENIRIILVNIMDPLTGAGADTTDAMLETNNAADVYQMLVFARDAYGIVPLQGENAVTPHVYNPGQITPADPLGQQGFVSWKTMQSAIILNQLWMARYECAATNLA